MAVSSASSSNLTTETYQGISLGMNTGVPAHEIPDTQARWMQDIVLDQPGLIKQRGALQKISGSATIPLRVTGLAGAQDPTGNYRIALIAGSAATATMYIYDSSSLASNSAYTIPSTTFDPAVARYVFDSKPALLGGSLVGVSNQYPAGASTKASLFLWRGAKAAADVSTTLSANLATGSTTMTVASGTGILPGMFAFNNATAQLIGTVKSVSGTTVTLDTKAWETNGTGTVNSGSTIKFQVIRGLNPKAMKGRITTLTTSPIVQGTQGSLGTKFKSQGLDSATGAWDLYRLSDDTFIGTVAWNSTTDNNAQLTLAANAAVGMTNERYYGVHRGTGTGSYSVDVITTTSNRPSTVGILNAQANGLQFYANRPIPASDADYSSRLWFSDPADPEGLDLSADDGDFIDVQSSSGTNTPIIAIQGIAAGLVIFKETETWLLTGTDATSFVLRKVADVGCLSTGSVIPYANGVIWTARDGIMYFDGSSLQSKTSALGDWWTQSILSFQTASHRANAVIFKDHYIVNVESFASTQSMTAGSISVTPTRYTFVINMLSGAVTVWTNTAFKAGLQMPPGSTLAPLAAVDDGGTPGTGYIVDIPNLFTNAANVSGDQITCGGWTNQLGPSFYLETKKYDMGDPQRKKLFKQIAMQYILQGNSLAMDTVPGLRASGTPTVTPWTQTADWVNARQKFTKRDTHMGFRMYGYGWPGVQSTITALEIGPFDIGFKFQRIGRV